MPYIYGAENRRRAAAMERIRGKSCPHGNYSASACSYCIAEALVAVDEDQRTQELEAKVAERGP